MKKYLPIKKHLSEIRESVKAIEAEETNSGDKMNDDDGDVVLL